MKATIDIPDELYRQVKSKSALRGQAVREVAIHLFQGWVSQEDEPADGSSDRIDEETLPDWFGAAQNYAQRVPHHEMSSVRESIAKGRMMEQKTDR